MRTKSLLVASAACLIVASSVSAVTFDDGGVHVIDENNSYPFEGVVVEDGPLRETTTLNVLPGGQIGTDGVSGTGKVDAYGSSIVNISGGAIEDDLRLFDDTVGHVSGGRVGGGNGYYVYVLGHASFHLSDGLVSCPSNSST
jgi:hypothetical protein